MKLVSLAIMAMTLSFGAAAQTTGDAAEKGPVAKVQQRKKGRKAKSPAQSLAAAENAGVTTLKDEKAYQAKWTFEQLLKRRMEVDAAEADRKQRRE